MEDLLEARRVLENEAQAILDLSKKLNSKFSEAMDLLIQCKGKIVLSGIGKSGHIARKISSTLSSTGSPSFFVHPAESSHGDMGMISKNDLVILISNSGGSNEIKDIISYVSRNNIPLIAMTAKAESDLAKAANIVLDISVKEEACPMGLAPTTSTTVSLALGDAIAMALLKRKGFQRDNYAEYHPGGSLGRKLLTKVKDVMHTGESLPLVQPDTLVKDVISAMTRKEVRGIAGVINENDQLLGVITDGDIRRRLDKTANPLTDLAKDLMSTNPKTILADELAEKALFVMEQFSIQSLFVISPESKKPVGILHLQDLLKASIR